MRSYLLVQPGDPFDAERIDRSLKALFATGLFADVKLQPRGRRAGRPGGREPDHQPHRLRGQLASSPTRTSTTRSSCARASSTRARRCRATSSASSISIAATAASPRPSIPRSSSCRQNRVDLVFEINEGPSTGVRSINFVGNRAVRRRHAARGHRDQGKPLVPLPVDRRHLRSRPAHLRPRAAAQILSVRGLCRFPRGLGGGRADARRATASSSPSRSTRASATSSARSTSTIKLKDLTREAVLPLLTVQAGDWYNADAVEHSITALTDALGNRGYAFVEVKPAGHSATAKRTRSTSSST